MESVLVVGVDGVVGANLAAVLGERAAVSGVSRRPVDGWSGGLDVLANPGLAEIRAVLQRRRPARMIYCAASPDSCWTGAGLDAAGLQAARLWVQAAGEVHSSVTLISSDAVFTGPWMFHAENSTSLCESASARLLRELESHVTTTRPDALIVRTHALGWAPTVSGALPDSWIDRIVPALESGKTPPLDCVRHASPILATELAGVLQKAWSAGLNGIYHVAGAERTSPVQVAQRLAQQWRYPAPPRASREALIVPASGFGSGETSLQTRKIRRALGISLPLLQDSLQKLYDQACNGYRDRLRGMGLRQRRAA